MTHLPYVAACYAMALALVAVMVLFFVLLAVGLLAGS